MKVIRFFIFILVTSCSTLNVLVMSGQLKVGYQTTAAAAKLFRSLWCNFIYRNFYQCIPANSLTSGANYILADMKLMII